MLKNTTRTASSFPRKRYTIKPAAALLLCLALFLFASPKNIAEGKPSFYVSRVVDGDTLKLSDGRRVRLIGVDTPEVHYSAKLLKDAERSRRDIAAIQELGKKAAAFTKNLCDKKEVTLEYDIEKKDRYGRTLAYVYLEDGAFLNAKILEEGYGQVMTIPPNVKYAGYFLRLQQEARKNNRGLWKKELNP